MSWRMFRAAIFVFTLCVAANASITEIRQNFFNQTGNLPATPIMASPTGDASYLIAVYESAGSASATPTLRWTDENGVPRTKTGGFHHGICQLLAAMRVKAGTQPTVETTGYTGTGSYALYVSGLGFWSSGTQGQAGLSEVTGTANKLQTVYTATQSISALLVAFSETQAGQQHFTWWDENGQRTASVTYGAPITIPIRIAGGSSVVAYTPAGKGVWYGLILFALPAFGSGPFGDYESNLLNWTSATYPAIETVFNPATSGRNVVLLMSNIAQLPNRGGVNEQLYTFDQGPMPCGGAVNATPSGAPASCVGPVSVGVNVPLQFWTINSPGSPWGPSPTYTAEVDVLQF
jgi:hypothetical protein